MQKKQTIAIIICIFMIVGILVWFLVCPPWNGHGIAVDSPRSHHSRYPQSQQFPHINLIQGHQTQMSSPQVYQSPSPQNHSTTNPPAGYKSTAPAKPSSPKQRMQSPKKGILKTTSPPPAGAAKVPKASLLTAKAAPAKKPHFKPPTAQSASSASS